MIPYTYLIKHIPTNKYYYGVKFKKGCHPNDFWIKYFTSSKKVKGLIRRYGKKSFQFEIRKTFKTPQEAIKWESKVLKRMKVIYRKDFLNLTDNKSIDPDFLSKVRKGRKHSKETIQKMIINNTGKNHPMYGRKHSKETIQKMIINNTGKNHPMYGKKLSKETKLKLRLINLDKKHSKKSIRKMSLVKMGKNNAMYGRKHTKETKEKMRFAWERRRVA